MSRRAAGSRVEGRASGRRARMAIACLAIATGAACRSFAPARPAALRPDDAVDIRFVAPVIVRLGRPGRDSLDLPAVTRLTGHVRAVRGDTLWLTRLSATRRRRGLDVPRGATTQVVLAPGDEVSVSHVSARKTTFAVLGTLALGFVLTLAFAISTN